jgi:ABC-2 type transport system permease protein
MFADAIAAERFRLLRDRSALFWGFVFAPLVGFFLSVGGAVVVRNMVQRPMPGVSVDLAAQVLKALSGAASTFPALFLMIGAVAVLAGDYRWETWRLLTPRNTRPNLLGAKLVVVGEAILWNLVLTVILTVAAGVIGAGISGQSMVVSTIDPGDIAGAFVVTWLEAMTLASLAALVAVITRSTMAAVVVCLGARFVQSILASVLGAFAPAPTWKTLAIPAYCADLLRAFVSAPFHGGVNGGAAGVALLVLLAWTALLAGGAIYLFTRQDLTRE